MPLDLDYIKKINNCWGTSSKQESDIFSVKQEIIENFEDTIDYYLVTFNNNTIKQGLLITHDYKDSCNKKIKSRPNETYKLGDIVHWNNLSWLVYDVDSDQQIYTCGQMKECNYVIKFQNTKGTILSYPAVFTNSSTYGIDNGQIITTPKQQYTVKLTLDNETELLKLDRRFLVDIVSTDMCAYKLIKRDVVVDNYGNGGVLNFTLEQCEHTDKDRDDLGIADYFEVTPIPIPTPSTDYISKITNSASTPVEYNNTSNIATLKIGGSLKPFVPHFYNSSGVEISNINPVWSIDVSKLTTSQQSKIHLTYNASYPLRCYLNVDDDDLLIGISFVLTLSSSDGLYHNSIQVSVVSYV